MGAVFFAKGGTNVGRRRRRVHGGCASFAFVVRRVASNFLQHCKKWMRDGFASSSSSPFSFLPSFYSGFFYKNQGFSDWALYNHP